jgi:hypothetical protein
MGTNLVPALSKIFEKENSVRNPWVCLGEGYIPLARERASELVDMFFLCMSPLSDEKANKKIQHRRGFGGGRVGVRYSTLLSLFDDYGIGGNHQIYGFVV